MRPLFNTAEAAKYLVMSERTLERWRLQGAGPTYIKIGSLVRYDRDDLEAWEQSMRSHGDAECASSCECPQG